MTYRRLYAIPDIHGRHDLLALLLNKVYNDGFNKDTDRMVFLGDYIDRGPDSKSVVATIKRLVENGEADAVVGNHEDFAIDYYVRNRGKDLWLYNGGYATWSSYGDGPLGRMDEDHVRFLGSLPTSLAMQGFFFSHAPVPREKARLTGGNWRVAAREEGEIGQPYTRWELTWYYIPPEAEKGDDSMMAVHEGPIHEGEHLTGVCGHIHRGPSVRDIRVYPKYRMLDCGAGCFPTGSLVAHECIENRTIYARPEDLRDMVGCVCDIKPIGTHPHSNPLCPAGAKERSK